MATGLFDVGLICSLGDSKQTVIEQLSNAQLNQKDVLSEWATPGIDGARFFVGAAKSTLPNIAEASFNTRNNQLLLAAFEQIKDNFNLLVRDVPAARVAIVLGTSTSGIAEGEVAYKALLQSNVFPAHFDYNQQELNAPSAFLASLSGATGPCYTISTACSSSGKALVSAQNLLNAGVADIVLCGGVDSLCEMTLNGFNALESTSNLYCKPFHASRDGINIGEAAALFIMTKTSSQVSLLGCGESSDAYHMSAPEPSGRGAISSMSNALQDAGLLASDIDYVNAHGTGTIKNDEMEAQAIHRLGFHCPVSSTKGITGHTLGAAGALEAAICWLLLSDLNKEQVIPRNLPSYELADDLAPIRLAADQSSGKLRTCLTNSFAFGGNNVSLILGN